MSKTIVVVETARGPSLGAALAVEGLQVACVTSAEEAVTLCAAAPSSLILVALPLQDGIATVKYFQQCGVSVPTALITRQDGVFQLQAFYWDQQTNTYVLTPLEAGTLGEQIARLHTSRRVQISLGGPVIESVPLSIDLGRRRLLRNGQLVRLTPTEWSLVELLVRNAGLLVAQRTLLTHVWGESYAEAANYLHVYMNRLRAKLEEDPNNPRYLLTEPGKGYRFIVPATSELDTPAPPAPDAGPTPQNTTRQPALEPARPPLAPLPLQMTSFIGREQEIAEAGRLIMQPEVRLLTLMGVGGIGKTRLALQVGAELQEAFADGVCFVPLASLHAPELVPAAIAQALMLKENHAQPLLSSLTEALRDQQKLIILDNFEQLLPAAPVLSELLAHAPGVKLLVTSRTTLRVSGQYMLVIPPLPLPDLQPEPDPQTLKSVPAVALFLARAQTVQPDFSLSDESLLAVARLCLYLEGLPLAIELAASRTRLLSPHLMLQKYPSRLAMLSSKMQDLPPRQQSLRATLEWSYQLLDEAEQRLFRRFAVFAGGVSFDVLEALCHDDQADLATILDGVEDLLDNNLLLQKKETSSDLRLGMLETIREYALERLREAGEEGALRRRYADYFLSMAEQGEPGLMGPEQPLWLHRLQGEYDNFRAVLSWALEHGEREVGTRLAAALGRFWHLRCHFYEGRQWLGRILKRWDQSIPPSLRAKLLYRAGVLACCQDDYQEAEELLGKSIVLLREHSDPGLLAGALNQLAQVAWCRGDYGRSVQLVEESLALWRAVGDKPGIAACLTNLGLLMLELNDYPLAVSLQNESLALCRELCNPREIANALNNLALTYEKQGDRGPARQLLEECIPLYRELHDLKNLASSLGNLARVMFSEGEIAAAAVCLREGLGYYRELGNRLGMSLCLMNLAGVAVAQQQFELGARLYGAAEGLREQLGATFVANQEASQQEILRSIQGHLGEPELRLLCAQGRAMELQLLISEVMSSPVPQLD